MTRAPWVLPKTEKPYPGRRSRPLVSTTLGWRLVNPAMPPEWTVSLGEATEQLREKHGVTRERQDDFAARSHRLADEAWNDGFYDDLVVPRCPASTSTRDEAIRPGTTAEKLAGLARRSAPRTAPSRPATPRRSTTAPPPCCSAVRGRRRRLGLDPLARIAGRGAHALEPQYFGYAPVEAANDALARAGIGWDEVGAVELNEAFAAQSLACLDAWGIDPDDRQPARRRHRHRPPARRLGRPHPRHPGPRPAAQRAGAGASLHLHRRRPGPRRRPRERRAP